MEFFTSAVGTLQTLVVALGAGLGVWGIVNLLEGYGADNPAALGQSPKRSKSTNGGRRRMLISLKPNIQLLRALGKPVR